MTTLDELLVDLAGGLPDGAGSPEDGVRVEVSSAGLELPVETWIGAGGQLHACAPRNRMVTGFQLPVGRLAVGFERGEP